MDTDEDEASKPKAKKGKKAEKAIGRAEKAGGADEDDGKTDAEKYLVSIIFL